MKCFCLIVLQTVVLSLFTPLLTNAQQVFNGKVVNEQSGGIPFVNVLVVESFSKPTIIAFALTNDKGEFSLSHRCKTDSLYVLVKGLNVKPTQRKVANTDRPTRILAKESRIEIKEVTVTNKRVWATKDTINYLVSSFQDKNDATIGDVLKKMPGINVRSSGMIEYNGIPINKFYIEGLDLLKGRYGLATNNLSPSDISTVQVLEHHQPIKALKELSSSNQAAINLRLKDSSRGIFSLIALLGVGCDTSALGESEFIASYFTRQKQYLAMYKGNNCGVDLEREIRKLNVTEKSNGLLTSLQQPLPPNISKDKYYDNLSNLGTVNTIFKNSKGNESCLNLFYLGDKVKSHSGTYSSFLLPDGTYHYINEAERTTTLRNSITGEYSYKVNRTGTYLSEVASCDMSWVNGDGAMSAGESIFQKADNTSIHAVNGLCWIAKTGEYTGWTVNSEVDFKTTPQNLYVAPNLFASYFAGDVGELHQHVGVTSFYTQNKAALLSGFRFGGIRFSPDVFVEVNRDVLTSTLRPTAMSFNLPNNDRFRNDMSDFTLKVGPSISARYASTYFDVSGYFPFFYYNRIVSNDISGTILKDSKVYGEPSLSLNGYRGKWDFGIKLYRTIEQVGFEQLYTGSILTNYRTLSRYDPLFNDRKSNNISGTMSYKNSYRLLFANVQLTYSRFSSDALYGQTFDGMLSKITALQVDANGHHSLVRMEVSKGFDWKKLNLGMSLAWYSKNTPVLRQDTVVRYLGKELSAQLKLFINPFSFMSISLEELWAKEKGRQQCGDAIPAIITATSKMDATVNIKKDFSISSSFYSYYNSRTDGRKDFNLVNVKLQYTRKTTRYSIEWNNIFNVDTYETVSLSALSSTRYVYYIRPASILFSIRFKIW